MSTKDEMISAQVVLFAPGGKNLLKEKQITTNNIQHVSPSMESIHAATVQLQNLGFQCTVSYPTLSISGPRLLFEKTFQLSFEKKQQQGTSYFVPTKKAKVPAPLKDIVADVIFGEPMEYFF